MIQLLYCLKGIAIGIANIIPGFSGGTMAVILKVYNEFVDALGNLVTHPIQIIKKYYGLFLGIFMGLVSALVIIVKLLESFPLPTVLFFVGLIIGSIPSLSLDFKNCGKMHWYDAIGFIIAFIIIITLPLIPGNEKTHSEITPILIISLIVSGLLASSSMIIPGVSGSLILMVFGYYLYILTTVKDFIKSIITFEFNNFFNNIIIIISFAIGIIIGLVFITKLIKSMFNKTPKLTYAIILGLLFGSPFSIIYSVNQDYSDSLNINSAITIIASVVTLILGAILSGYIPKRFAKTK